MRTLATPGLAGAMIGLALGLVEYFIAMTMVRRFVAREIGDAKKSNETLPGMSLLAGNTRMLRIILILAAVTIYPLVGYVVGTMVGS